MTAAVTTRLRAPVLGRVAAALAVGSAGLHQVLAASGGLGAWTMAAMALVCLPCAVHLWRAPSASVWGLTAVVDLGMVALHAPMVAGQGMPGMHHAQGPAVVALAVVLGQLVLAGAALVRR